MNIAYTSTQAAPRQARHRQTALALAAGLFLACTSPIFCQQSTEAPAPMLLASSTGPSLPDAPSATSESSSSASPSFSPFDPGQPRTHATAPLQHMASPTDKYIAPGQPVPTLTVGNKMLLGIKDAVSPLSAVGWIVSAGYEQGTNGSPNYGTNGTAFAQRFGASAARSVSEGIFSDSIMSSVLHEDPRYYRMGPGNNFIKRAAYAATRTLVTRTDSGRTTPNFAFLAGNFGGAYLTKTYYPPLNTSTTEVLKTFGGSVGGSALGFLVSEFLSGGLNLFHASKPTAN